MKKIATNLNDTGKYLDVIVTDQAVTTVCKRDLQAGVNELAGFIIIVDPSLSVQSVYDTVCDHAGGKLCRIDGNEFRCPMHGWEFNAADGLYNNGQSKQALPYTENSEFIYINSFGKSLKFPDEFTNQDCTLESIVVRHVAHACVNIVADGVSILLDPWLFGPAFSTGWWHAFPPKADVYQLLSSVTFVVFSHNHSDHISSETLQYLGGDVVYAVPEFSSGSAYAEAKKIGVKSPVNLEFNKIYQLSDKIFLSVLKSGDFRDDSGVYLRVGRQEFLFTVDSNALNSWVLPQKIDVLFTAFSSGASGYPWCWGNYTEEEKRIIATKSKIAASKQVDLYVDIVKPKYYVAYAGFFAALDRFDSYINKNLIHNTPEKLRLGFENRHVNVGFINPNEYDCITIESGHLSLSSVSAARAYSVDQFYIDSFREKIFSDYHDFSIAEIAEYFSRQVYRANLLLLIELCDWDWSNYEEGAIIDFSNGRLELHVSSRAVAKVWERRSDNRKLYMKVRKMPFARVIREKLSWEEISIGFQAVFKRDPDVYNVDFWDYFSNKVG